MNPSTPDPFYEEEEEVDHVFYKSAAIGCWITVLLTSCLLNAVVSALTIRRLTSQTGSARSTHRPQLTVILTCCLVFIFSDAVVNPMVVHVYRVGWEQVEFVWSCDTMLASHVMLSTTRALPTLLVSGLVVVEGLRLHHLVTPSSTFHNKVSLVVIVLSLLYAPVVIVPVFFFRALRDHRQPCYEDSLFPDLEDYKVMEVVDFIVPQCLLFLVCLLLLVVHFIRPGSCRRAGGSTLLGLSPGSGSSITSQTNASEAANLGPLLDYSPGQQQPEGINSAHRVPFPWYILLAAASSFVFTFLLFLNIYADIYIMMSPSAGVRLWFSGLLLDALTGVFVPCCWLINREVRPGACCGSPTPGDTARSPQPSGEETGNTTEV